MQPGSSRGYIHRGRILPDERRETRRRHGVQFFRRGHGGTLSPVRSPGEITGADEHARAAYLLRLLVVLCALVRAHTSLCLASPLSFLPPFSLILTSLDLHLPNKVDTL